jgi:drug/metabolite transporter (DMT)-like permease
VLLTTITGLVFLFRSESNFVSKNAYITSYDFTYNNFSAYVYGVLAIICWGLANSLLQKQRAYVHHSIDTFYVSFFMSIIIPAFILGYFSIHPTNLTYEWIQFVYFGISGFLWFLFHTLYTQVIE